MVWYEVVLELKEANSGWDGVLFRLRCSARAGSAGTAPSCTTAWQGAKAGYLAESCSGQGVTNHGSSEWAKIGVQVPNCG